MGREKKKRVEDSGVFTTGQEDAGSFLEAAMVKRLFVK